MAVSYNCTSFALSSALAAHPLSYFQDLLSLWPQLSQHLAHCIYVSGSCSHGHSTHCLSHCSIGNFFTVSDIGDKEVAASDLGHQANVKGMKGEEESAGEVSRVVMGAGGIVEGSVKMPL